MAEGNQLERQLWWPQVGWQVLRRLERYQRAVDRFVEAAIEAEDEDGPSLYAIEFASYVDDENPDELGNIRTKRTIAAEEMGSAVAPIKRPDSSIEYALFSPDGDDSPRFDLVTKTDYFQDFAKEFGFALRYPIKYEVSEPNQAFLESLWLMHPAADYSESELETMKNQNSDANRLASFNVTIDWLLDDQTIRKYVSSLLEDVLAQRKLDPLLKKKQYALSEDIDDALKTWDFHKKHPNLSWSDLAQELGHKSEGDRPFDKTRGHVKTIKKLLKNFEQIAENYQKRALEISDLK